METQLVAQIAVAQQHFHLGCAGRLIYLVGGLPADHVLGAFRHDRLVSHLVQVVGGLVGVQ